MVGEVRVENPRASRGIVFAPALTHHSSALFGKGGGEGSAFADRGERAKKGHSLSFIDRGERAKWQGIRVAYAFSSFGMIANL